MDDSSSLLPASDVVTEQGRLNTFQNWPHSAAVDPASLAQAGFFYLGQADRVRCAFCGGTLKNWRHGDDPWQEHLSHFAQCLFIQGHNVQSTHMQPAHSNSISLGMAEAGGMGFGRLNPHHPDYQTMDSRLASFQGWPQTTVQKPADLIEAGFFYTGQTDCVRCFCCGGTLRNWEPSDQPWDEHAHWFPRCPYLLQQKGRGYMLEVQRRLGPAGRARVTPSPSSSPSRKGIGGNDKLAQMMQYESVKEALSMGFKPEQVQRALQKILTSSGGKAPDLSQLVNMIIGDDKTSVVQSARGSGQSEQAQEAGPTVQRSGNDDRTLCKICLDREVEVTFLPCGHLVCCAECSKHVQQCPVCRRIVKASMRTFLS